MIYHNRDGDDVTGDNEYTRFKPGEVVCINQGPRMKQPPKQLFDAFFSWLSGDAHHDNENAYDEIVTRKHLGALSKAAFIAFFYDFCHEGGKIQGNGQRKAPQFRETITRQYTAFRNHILKAFEPGLEVPDWLQQCERFKFFGIGLATIFLNRVNSSKFAVLNNKTRKALALLDVTLPSDNPAAYQAVLDAHRLLMQWDPRFQNYYRTDALMHYLIGVDEGIDLAEKLLGSAPGDPAYWIFQGNPKYYDVVGALEKSVLKSWQTKQHRKKIKRGDKVIVWLTGPKAGCYALCTVTSAVGEVKETKAEAAFWKVTPTKSKSMGVTLAVVHNFCKDPVFRSAVANLPEFVGFKAGTQLTNMTATKEQYNKLQELGTHGGGELMSQYPLNLVLYGPPGTGKTYHAGARAVEICDGKKYGDEERETVELRFRDLLAADRIGFVTFHQSYGYEEFVEGIRPMLENEKADEPGDSGRTMRYELRDGIFKRMANAAKKPKAGAVRAFKPDFAKTRVWKMSLGAYNDSQDDWIYDECVKNNMLLLGYGLGLDFTDCRDSGMISDKLKNADVTLKDNAYHIRAVDLFRHEMQKNDIVIVSAGNTKFRAIGRVAGDYEFRAAEEYGQMRPVEWLAIYEEPLSASRILKKDFAMRALYELRPATLNQKALEDLLTGKADTSNHVLIIDEINRGNISKIFGELITLLEEDKRQGAKHEIAVNLPYSPEPFTVPPNLHVIGTMNTADRSIAFMDTALRRRFRFEEMPPRDDLIVKRVGTKGVLGGIDVAELMRVINSRIEYLFDRDHRLGHSFFLKNMQSLDDLKDAFCREIIPHLQEYFYEDWSKVCAVLGCPVDRETGKLVAGVTAPVILARVLTAPAGADDEEIRLTYEINPTFIRAGGDDLQTFFNGVVKDNMQARKAGVGE